MLEETAAWKRLGITVGEFAKGTDGVWGPKGHLKREGEENKG